MNTEVITESDNLVIRRLVLGPGEKMYWHTDVCRRFSVVVRGSRLAIEYLDDQKMEEFDVHAGMADWDEPDPKVHRAINRGDDVYEEVVTFYRASRNVEPQPRAEDGSFE